MPTFNAVDVPPLGLLKYLILSLYRIATFSVAPLSGDPSLTTIISIFLYVCLSALSIASAR